MVQFLVRKLGPVGNGRYKSETGLKATWPWWKHIGNIVGVLFVEDLSTLKTLSFWLSNASGDALRKNSILDWMDSDHVDKSLWPYQLLEMLNLRGKAKNIQESPFTNPSYWWIGVQKQQLAWLEFLAQRACFQQTYAQIYTILVGFSKGDW